MVMYCVPPCSQCLMKLLAITLCFIMSCDLILHPKCACHLMSVSGKHSVVIAWAFIPNDEWALTRMGVCTPFCRSCFVVLGRPLTVTVLFCHAWWGCRLSHPQPYLCNISHQTAGYRCSRLAITCTIYPQQKACMQLPSEIIIISRMNH